jgi:DnaK suppressor protein
VNLEHYRRRLLELEQELVDRLGQEIDTARNIGDDQAAASDLAHVDELKEEYYALADTDSVILEQVRTALQRIDEGTFGVCVVDNRPIEEKRLQAVPWTRYCLKHQEAIEERRRMHTPTL